MPVPPHLTAAGLDSRVTELVDAALSLDSPSFCSHQILDRVPWIFDGDRIAYVNWKQELAANMEIDPYAICIVGSAATGVSLSPKKSFRLFSTTSDVDVAIVSAFHFDIAWRTIRSFARRDVVLTRQQKRGLRQHRSGLLFDGCIATDQILKLLDYGPKWSNALARAGRREPLVGHEVKARLYRDFEALRSYQMKSAYYTKEQFE